MAEKTGKEKLFEAALNLAKPEVEKLVERNLVPMLDIPLLRELFNISPKLMVSLLSLGIGMIPESMKRSPMGSFLIDLAETMPREIGRLLAETDASSQPDPAAAIKEAAATHKKGTKKIFVSSTTAKSPDQPILALVDEKMFGHINSFMSWFRKLSEIDKRKVERYVLSLTPEQIKVFVEINPKNKDVLISRFPKITRENIEEIIPGFVSVFVRQVAKRMRKGAGKKAKTKHYGPLSRFAYAFSGNPIDKEGKRRK